MANILINLESNEEKNKIFNPGQILKGFYSQFNFDFLKYFLIN